MPGRHSNAIRVVEWKRCTFDMSASREESGLPGPGLQSVVKASAIRAGEALELFTIGPLPDDLTVLEACKCRTMI